MMFRKITSIFMLVSLLALTFASPAYAFDGRQGDKIVIKANETIDDDLYVGAKEFLFEGKVTGDLIVGGQFITINGNVDGDLMAAGQAILINGTIKGDARVFAQAVQLGPDAVINGDLVFGGASLEMMPESMVSNEIVLGAGQALLAGKVGREVVAGAGALELAGTFAGNVYAYVDQNEETKAQPSPSTYMNYGAPLPFPLPNVPSGLTVDKDAKIAGDLEYSSTIDLPVPKGVVVGNLYRVEPKVEPLQPPVPVEPTNREKVMTWGFDIVRSLITLLLVGLLAGWLLPLVLKSASDKLKTKTLPSFGWGMISYAAFFFAMFVVTLFIVFIGVLFAVMTLGGLSATVFVSGFVALVALTVAFVIVVAYLSKVVVGTALGKWLLNLVNPALAERKFLSMFVGVTLVVLLVAAFDYPLASLGIISWMLNFMVVVFGVGAIWLMGRERFGKKPAAVAPAPVPAPAPEN